MTRRAVAIRKFFNTGLKTGIRELVESDKTWLIGDNGLDYNLVRTVFSQGICTSYRRIDMYTAPTGQVESLADRICDWIAGANIEIAALFYMPKGPPK